MRKTAVLLLIMMLSVFILAGCRNEEASLPAATAVETAAAASPTPAATATAPPKYTPADILGEELNPLYGMEFPEGFTLETVLIHSPGWDIAGDDTQYHMYLLAPGDNGTIAAMAGIMGVTSEDTINGYIDAFLKDGSVVIDGDETAGAAGSVCQIRKTDRDNGWEVHVVSIIGEEDEGKYLRFIEDSYNMNVFGTASKSMALLPVPDDFKINVCYVEADDMMKTEFEVIYTLDDRPAVMDGMITGGGYDWYDGQNKTIGIDYGDMHGDIRFAESSNQINVRQECKGVPATPLSEYVYQPTVTLETYGFGLDTEKGLCLYEEHNGAYSKLGFHSPEWGDMDDPWEVEFLYTFENGWAVLWYLPEENRYDIRLEQGDRWAGYSYDAGKNTYGSMNPDKGTVDEMLNDFYAGGGGGDLYARIFDMLEQYSLDLSGKGFEELAALPPTEGSGFAPIPVPPVLPEPGKSRTTLAFLGFQYEEENGCWMYRDRDGGKLIDIHFSQDLLQYFQTANGHSLVISYYPDKGRYEAEMYEDAESTDGGAQSHFAYDIKNNAVLDGYTDGIDMKPEEFFPKMLGIPQTGTVFLDVISIFQQYTIDRFGLTNDELFRLDAE